MSDLIKRAINRKQAEVSKTFAYVKISVKGGDK